MRTKRAWPLVILAGALLVFSIACLDDDGPTGPGQSLPFSNLHATNHSGIMNARTEVIRDDARWAVVWAEIHSRGSLQPPRPSVDFTREMLVLVGIGERNDGCWEVEILELSSAGGRIRVRAEERHRVCGACTQATTQPVQVVRTARTDGGSDPQIGARTVSCQ